MLLFGGGMYATLMRRGAIAVALLASSFTHADLREVRVSGELRIRGNWYDAPRFGEPPFGMAEGPATRLVEQRTRVGVDARFGEEVTALFELDAYGVWGEDFRSGYVSGRDGRGDSREDVDVYQAWLEWRTEAVAGLSFRFGRQDVSLGSEWLIGNGSTGSFFRGLSLDGIRADWSDKVWRASAGWFRLGESSPAEEDGDIDLAFAELAYAGFEGFDIGAYWIGLRDGRGSGLGFPFDTPNAPAPVTPTPIVGRIEDWVEDFFGVDQYEDTTSVHTLGLRVAGEWRRWDFEAEGALQRVNAANSTKTFFNPDPASLLDGNSLLPFGGPYGEDDAAFWLGAFDVEIGYSFDHAMMPRAYAGTAWFEGRDNRGTNFGQFVRNLIPFFEQRTSVAFNRLFSDREYSDFIDDTDLSNVLILRGGVEVSPLDELDLLLEGVWFQTDDRTHTNGLFIFPFLAFPHSDELGWELRTRARYAYSADIEFAAGYSRFFGADGLDDSNFFRGNGLLRAGGTGYEDSDYVYFETTIRF